MSLLIEGIGGSLKLMLSIATIIIPLITVLEVLKETKLIESFSTLLEPVVSFFRLPKEAALPMVIGVVFGITYGAGVIIQAEREGKLNKRDFVLIFSFFAINHGIIEDTLLFSRLGAKGWILVLMRFIFSVTFVYFLAIVMERRAARAQLPIKEDNIRT